MPLRNRTIKTKLSLFLMATSTLAVLLVCMMFYFLVARHFQMTYHRDLENLTTIVGHNCKAALVFNVPEDAETVLNSLESRQSIFAVRLYDKNHKPFAAYTNHPDPAAPAASGQEIRPDPKRFLTIEQPITLDDGTVVGTIVVHDDIRDIALSKKKGIPILAVAGLIALLATFLLASFLQNIISRPLLALTGVVQRLASGDFAARNEIRVQSQDEVGMLSAAFVDMSRKLEESYITLEAYSHTLEERVEERTEALQRALDDLTRSQEQLIQSEKMVALGHLVAGVAHEINNNINFIACAIPFVLRLTKGLASLCAAEDRRPEEREQIVRKIEGLLRNAEIGVQRTAKIVLDLNKFARPSHGKLTRTNVHQEIETVLTLLRYELHDRIGVKLEFAPDLPTIFCHQDQMNQVYMNILRNAIQAIDDKGTIRIKTWLDDDMINISFQDSGRGIPKAARTKIFDPFFTTKPVGEGTGLGLSISYGIVKNHHGEIFVDATGNQGTTFLLRLPTGSEPPPDEEETSCQQPSQADAQGAATADPRCAE